MCSGEGYIDHQWGNAPIPEILQFHFWGRVYLPGYTLVYWDGELADTVGYGRFKRLWVIKGEKLIDFLKDDIYIKVSDLLQYASSAGMLLYPNTQFLIIDSSRIRGIVTFRIKSHMMHLPVAPVTGRTGRPVQVNSLLSDCDAKLEIDGEKVEATSFNIHSRMMHG